MPNLIAALILFACEDHLAEHGIDGELCHASAHLCELSSVIERAQCVEHLEGANERLGRRRIEKVKVNEIVDPERLEQQNDVPEVRPLDLRDRVVLQLVLIGPRREQTEALARTDATGSSSLQYSKTSIKMVTK